jgi:hypothetical protein
MKGYPPESRECLKKAVELVQVGGKPVSDVLRDVAPKEREMALAQALQGNHLTASKILRTAYENSTKRRERLRQKSAFAKEVARYVREIESASGTEQSQPQED